MHGAAQVHLVAGAVHTLSDLTSTLPHTLPLSTSLPTSLRLCPLAIDPYSTPTPPLHRRASTPTPPLLHLLHPYSTLTPPLLQARLVGDSG